MPVSWGVRGLLPSLRQTLYEEEELCQGRGNREMASSFGTH